MTRKFSSVSVETALQSGINSSTTTMTVTAGTGTTLMGGVSLSAGNVDQFTLAIAPDTINEEIVFATAIAADTLTIQRAKAGSSGQTHSAGAIVKHVLTSDDLNYFTTGVDAAVTLTGTQTLSNKTLTSPAMSTIVNTGTLTLPSSSDTIVGRATTDTLTNKTLSMTSNTLTGTTAQFNTALSDGDFATLAGTETLSGKTLTSPTENYPTLKSPQEITTVSATAATGTINFDYLTQAILYYTTNASANFTFNFRGNSSTALSSLMDTGDSVTVTFLNTNGTTAYYPTAISIDGTSITPKWVNGQTPSSGNASSIDAYSYTIIKTASTPTYVVLATQNKFA
jgi:hypothetical protein